jgi:hypothetical protein
VHAVRLAEKRDVDVVVDDEDRSLDQLAHSPCEGEQLATRKGFVPQLNYIGAATLRRFSYLEDVVWRCVRSYDVEAAGLQPLAGLQVRS